MAFPYMSEDMLALLQKAEQGDMEARVLMVQSELASGNLSPRGLR